MTDATITLSKFSDSKYNLLLDFTFHCNGKIILNVALKVYSEFERKEHSQGDCWKEARSRMTGFHGI